MKKRIDRSWGRWGIHIFRPRSWWTLNTPAGSIGINYHRTVTKQGVSRGRCQEWNLRIPLTRNWQLHLATRAKDYLTLVGGPEYLRNIGWILDEFDSCFNELAIASLRYHLDFSVCNNEDRRGGYEDLIARLSEREPGLTDEERDALYPPGWDWEDQLDRRDGRVYLRRSTPEESAIYATLREREDAYHERIQRARHDFVDIMRGLWS